MADTGTVRFMVTYMPIRVRVKRKLDQLLIHRCLSRIHSCDLPKDLVTFWNSWNQFSSPAAYTSNAFLPVGTITSAARLNSKVY